jgi:glycosyltransferase involved in cell wall biosynthesis
VRVLERRHDVWVLTRANNRRVIEDALSREPLPRARFVYYDLPGWARWWKRGPGGVQIYYYLWQLGIYRIARRLHSKVGFDLIHHVTFGKYCAPSLLCLLPAPFVWGPVGGGESAPRPFWRDIGLRGKMFEIFREAARWCGERDPLVRLTVRRSAIALAKAEDTAIRLRCLGARDVEVFSEGGLLMADLGPLAQCPEPPAEPLRFCNIGRLLHLKGFHLGLRAFARAGIPGAEYWIIGDGPERRRLEAEARALGVADRVRFWGWLSHAETLRRLADIHVLVHPTLHDSGGGASLEAMASGRPVVCLDLGGPSAQVVDGSGIKVAARDPDQAVRDLARAMRRLADDRAVRTQMGTAARRRSREAYAWEDQGKILDAFYRRAIEACRG